jgi:hypothetical protein
MEVLEPMEYITICRRLVTLNKTKDSNEKRSICFSVIEMILACRQDPTPKNVALSKP